MKSSAALLLAFMLISMTIATTDLKDTLTSDILYTTKGDTGFEYTTVHMNYNSDKKIAGGQIKLRPDLSYTGVSVGRKDSPAEWGVYCSKTGATNSSNNCVYTDESRDGKYMGQAYKNNPAFLFVPLTDKIDTESAKCTAEMIIDPPKDKWFMDDTGVWGLAPSANNAFFNYVFRQYKLDKERDGKPTFDFSMIYYNFKQEDKFKGKQNDTWSYSSLSLNGFEDSRADDSVKKVEILLDNKAPTNGFWTISQATLWVNDKSAVAARDACLVNTANTMFAMSDADKASFIKTLSQSACGKDSCTYAEAKDYKTSLEFKSGANNVRIILKPEDYTYDDNGALGVSIASLDTLKANGQCGAAHTLALGRLFFSRVLTTFSVTKVDEGNFQYRITLNEMRPVDKITNSERLVLLVFGLILICAIIGTIVYKVTRKSADEGAYRAAEST